MDSEMFTVQIILIKVTNVFSIGIGDSVCSWLSCPSMMSFNVVGQVVFGVVVADHILVRR